MWRYRFPQIASVASRPMPERSSRVTNVVLVHERCDSGLPSMRTSYAQSPRHERQEEAILGMSPVSGMSGWLEQVVKCRGSSVIDSFCRSTDPDGSQKRRHGLASA